MDERGTIAKPRPVTVELGDAVLTVQMVRVVAYVRTDSDSRREFARFCRNVGIAATARELAANDAGTFRRDRNGKAVQVRAGEAQPTAYECEGTSHAITRLTGHPVVWDWHPVVTGPRIPHGMGRESPKGPAPVPTGINPTARKNIRRIKSEGIDRAQDAQKDRERYGYDTPKDEERTVG